MPLMSCPWRRGSGLAQALVPLKDLVQAKTRLAGLLDPSQRRALAQAMVEDVLAVLAAHPEIRRTTLVSDDPGAGLLAEKYGVDYLPESSLGCRGLNAVVQRASEQLLAKDESPLVVLHGDLPLLSYHDISVVLQAQRQLSGLVVACDRQGRGTNLLAFAASCAPRFRFGPDSCARHLAWAHSAAIPVRVLQRPGIGLDIDEAADLKVLMASPRSEPRSKTLALLGDGELAARLALALATLPEESPQQNATQAAASGENTMDTGSGN